MDYGDGVAGRWGLVSADLIGMDEAWSSVEVSRVGGRSRLTSCLAVAPLKILSPKVEADYSTAVLSSYGGGLVAGDCARLRVHCGREAKLFLGTQAFTKVYKATDGQVARQELAEEFDVQVCIHTDTLNESGFVEASRAAFKGRTIHTYHTEGARGAMSPSTLSIRPSPTGSRLTSARWRRASWPIWCCGSQLFLASSPSW